MTLAETLVALALLGVAFLMGLSCIVWTARIERRAEQRTAAVELAASLAERARAAPYGSVASGALDLGAEYVGLPSPEAELRVEEDADLGLKRVAILVTWQGRDPGTLRLDTEIGAAEPYL